MSSACATKDTTLNDDDTVQCMLAEFVELRFTPSYGNITVEYPIYFAPGRPDPSTPKP